MSSVPVLHDLDGEALTLSGVAKALRHSGEGITETFANGTDRIP